MEVVNCKTCGDSTQTLFWNTHCLDCVRKQVEEQAALDEHIERERQVRMEHMIRKYSRHEL